jgi:hypothetical protein
MKKYPFIPGTKYFIRTVTMILCGECVADYEDMVVLTKASWIADTGRYQQALETGDFSEVEMYPSGSSIFVSKGGIIDGFSSSFELPTRQK